MKQCKQTVFLSGETALTIASFTLLYTHIIYLETEGLEMQKQSLFLEDYFLPFILINIFCCFSKPSL